MTTMIIITVKTKLPFHSLLKKDICNNKVNIVSNNKKRDIHCNNGIFSKGSNELERY